MMKQHNFSSSTYNTDWRPISELHGLCHATPLIPVRVHWMCFHGWQVILDVATYLVQAQRVIFKFMNIQVELTLPSAMAALFSFLSAYANTILLLRVLLLLLNCWGTIGTPGFLIKQDYNGIKDHNSCGCRRKTDIYVQWLLEAENGVVSCCLVFISKNMVYIMSNDSNLVL